MLFQYRLNVIFLFLLILTTNIIQSEDNYPVQLAVSPVNPTLQKTPLHLDNFDQAFLVAKEEILFTHLTTLQKVFAPQQPQQSQFFDLMTSWIFCIGILFILVLLFIINPSKPFMPEIANMISYLGYLVFSLGIIDVFRNIYFNQLIHEVSHGVYKLDKTNRFITVLLLSGVIFWLGRTIKKAVPLQKENDLTI
jgi:glucan phosphoethanolaminetransferase (alkaline phosphatase superfamily)